MIKVNVARPIIFFGDLVQGNSTHSPWWRDSHGAHICVPAVAIVGQNPPSNSFTCFYQRHLYVIIIIVNNLTIINILRVAIIAKKSQICGKILYPQVTGDLNATENGHRGVFCPKKSPQLRDFFLAIMASLTIITIITNFPMTWWPACVRMEERVRPARPAPTTPILLRFRFRFWSGGGGWGIYAQESYFHLDHLRAGVFCGHFGPVRLEQGLLRRGIQCQGRTSFLGSETIFVRRKQSQCVQHICQEETIISCNRWNLNSLKGGLQQEVLLSGVDPTYRDLPHLWTSWHQRKLTAIQWEGKPAMWGKPGSCGSQEKFLLL